MNTNDLDYSMVRYMVDDKIISAVKAAREGAQKRNFRQSFDVAVNFKSIDIKKQESKIKIEVILPHPPAGARIGIFAEALVPQAKKLGDNIVLISKEQLDGFARNKKAAKAVAKSVRGFLAEAPLMPAVAKAFGPVLAVRGKMPKPVPPTIPDLKPLVDRAAASVRLAVKDSAVVHARIGLEDMKDEEVAGNAEAVLKAIIAALPKGREQVKDAVIKLTMGKPVKFEVPA